MEQFVFVARDIQEIEKADHALEENGVARDRIRVLSEDNAAVRSHGLPAVNDFEKRDFVHSGLLGTVVGFALAAGALLLAAQTGLVSQVGWAPFLFLAVVLVGFCTWEGGLLGGMRLNQRYEMFRDALRRGAHIMIVDVEREQAAHMQALVTHHPALEPVGIYAQDVEPTRARQR